MLEYSTLPSGAPLTDALALMRDSQISMVLVTKDDDPSAIVGYFSERHYKEGVRHHDGAPPGTTVGSLSHSGVFCVSPSTPVVGAMHDLINAGARHVVLLRGGESTRVVQAEQVAADDVTAVVSIRDMLRHAAALHFRALSRAKDLQAAGDGAAEELAAWQALVEDKEALDREAYGAVVRDAEDALETLQKLGRRTAYVNCLRDSKVSAADATSKMTEAGVAAMLVVSEDASVEGIFTTRDLIWKMAASGGEGAVDAAKTPVTSVMTSPVHMGSLDWSVEKCARSMAKRKIRHLPIAGLESRQFVGLVSFADIARFVAKAPFPPITAHDEDGEDGEGAWGEHAAALRERAVRLFEGVAAFADAPAK